MHPLMHVAAYNLQELQQHVQQKYIQVLTIVLQATYNPKVILQASR